MSIPIRNLYYVFSYAWRQFPIANEAEVGVEGCPDILNLFGRLLCNGIQQLNRRGLDKRYSATIEETRAPRGKMLMDLIVKEQTMIRGSVICSRDELTEDVLHNQILKTTASRLRQTQGIDPSLKRELASSIASLAGVAEIRLQKSHFRRVQLGRNTQRYGPLLRLAEMLYDCLLPLEGGASFRFPDILRDQARMEAVFEDFLRSFFGREQEHFAVDRQRLYWDVVGNLEAMAYVPVMETDITMRSVDQTIIADAKYYSQPFSSSWGREKLHAANLYQITTYVRHELMKSTSKPVRGLLIYPSNDGRDASLRYQLSGHDIRVELIDFNRPWQEIHSRLLEAIV